MMTRQHLAVQSKPATAMAAAVGVHSEANVISRNENSFPSNSNGNGHQRVHPGRLADRLRNAAMVFDLRSELARALAVSEKAITGRIHRVEHHRAHLASAFFVSPFDRAALLSLDGFGDFVSTMWAIGEGKSIKVLGQVEYPHSLGILYTATTQFLGFPYYGDEGKVMGLAPCGQPTFIDQFRDIIRTEAQGQFSLSLDYFRHATEGVEMNWDEGSPSIGGLFSDKYDQVFGRRREQNSPLTERDANLAE